MSYEGYTEWECAAGHRDSNDVYDAEPTACHKCGRRFVRRRSIDQTNGREVLEWLAVEYRPRFNDYVAKGLYRAALSPSSEERKAPDAAR